MAGLRFQAHIEIRSKKLLDLLWKSVDPFRLPDNTPKGTHTMSAQKEAPSPRGRTAGKPPKAGGGHASSAADRAFSRAARLALDLYEMHRPRAARQAAGAAPRAGAGLTTVTFTCNAFPAALVGISTPGGTCVCQPDGTVKLPAGIHTIAWSARGTRGQDFTVTVTGGTLDMPIQSVISAGGNGGPRRIQVP